jgi:hypothetical protein
MQQATKRGFPCPNQRDLETLLVRVPLQQSHSWGRRCIVLGHKRWVTITYKRVRSGDAEDGGEARTSAVKGASAAGVRHALGVLRTVGHTTSGWEDKSSKLQPE